MKKARIKALHKEGDTDDITNYRPISILPVLSKIFERSASDQIVEFLETNKLINRNQHAYRKCHSTTTCLTEVTNYLYKLVDKKKFTAIASLDLSKAYDSICHGLLLHKLTTMGFGTEIIEWIKSYLKNRKQIIKFKKHTSEEETTLSGVPQGSILGPILFIIFTNDLADEFTTCKMISYADDCQLIVDADSMPELKIKLENVIVTAQKWYKENGMKNNIGKTKVLILKTGNQNSPTITVMDEGKRINIKPLKEIKILGIYLDDKLTWKRQISEVRKKASNVVRNLHRVNKLVPVKQRIQLYNALVTPHFSYADVIWGGCGEVNSKRLQTTQNYAVKSMLGMRKRDSATEALTQLKLLNLKQRRKVHEAVFTHKALMNNQPGNINDVYDAQLPTSNTRAASNQKLNLPHHRTSKYQHCPLFRTISTWNSLPNTLDYNTTAQLKTQYQRHLIHATYGPH